MVGLTDDSYKELALNWRIKVLEEFGTVRYLGEVENYPGEWIGVEWDDPTRGKHDGNIAGKRYFQTKYPKSGSMIRPEKIEAFQSLRQAIYERYLKHDGGDVLDESLLRETQSQLHAPLFEIVGMEKVANRQSHLEELVDVSAAISTVNCAGDLKPLQCLTALNVASTLIWNWRIVGDITRQIPTLRSLNLSSNRMVLPTEEEIVSLEPSFRHITQINLSRCDLNDWQIILFLAQLWSDIESLSLQKNDIERITVADCQKVFRNLRELYLSQNKLADFNEICKLGNVATLESIFLIENRIKDVILPDCEYQNKLEIFPALKLLNLSKNPIKDENRIFNELDKLPALQNLCKTPEDPLRFDDMFTTAVASMSQLKKLNKAIITNEERRGTEYEIWKKYANEWLQTDGDRSAREQFCKEHRTYANIVKRCGDPSDFSTINATKHRSNVIKIRIVHKGSEVCIEKKVPRLMSLHALHGFVIKQFHLGGEMPQLSYRDATHPTLIVPLDNLSKNLDFYSIRDGDTVIVE